MILVKSVEIEYVDDHEARIAIMAPMDYPYIGHDPAGISFEKEIIQSKVFINSKNEEVIVGLSSQVQRALGMPMDAFQGMNQDIERLTVEAKRYQRDFRYTVEQLEMAFKDLEVARAKVYEYKSASFSKRLKYLFRGRI